MIPLRIKGATNWLGAPEGWEPDKNGPCVHLAVKHECCGNVDTLTSAWEPTPEDIQKIMAGAPIYLRVVGITHPTVNVFVGPVPNAEVSG